MGYGRPVVQAEANDSLDVLQGDNCLALVGGQSARCFVGGDVATDAVHVQQAADLADLHFEVPVHLQHHSPVTRLGRKTLFSWWASQTQHCLQRALSSATLADYRSLGTLCFGSSRLAPV